MLSDLWNNVTSSYKAFVGTGSILVLFVLACFLIYQISSKNKDELSEYPLIILLLSVPGTIAVGISSLCNSKILDNKWKRLLVVLMCIFAITISGKRIIGPDFMSKAANNMHIANDMRDAMDAILVGDGSDSIGIVTMPGMGDYFEGYDARFHSMFDDDFDKDSEKIEDEYIKAYLEMSVKYPDMKIVSYTAREHGCKYIVIKRDSYWPKVPLTEIGYSVFGTYGEWDVYVQEGEI